MVERGVVEDDRVQLVARLKAADLAEERTAAGRGEPEGAVDGERLDRLVEQTPAQLRGADGRCDGGEEVLRLTAGEVGGQRDVHPLVEVAADGRDARGQIRV